jgi:NADH dehydrogenase FAD-containing subunit
MTARIFAFSVMNSVQNYVSLEKEKNKEKVVVIGHGWAGRSFCQTINTRKYDVTVIADQPFVDTTKLISDYKNAQAPYTQILRRCTHVNKAKQELQMEYGPSVKYDHLVLATGTEVNTFGVPGVTKYGITLKSLKDAELFWKKIPSTTALNIVGAGAVGIELAMEVRKRSNIPIRIFEATDTILLPYSQAARNIVENQLQQADITLHTKTPVKEVLATGVTSGTLHFEGDTTVWCTGIKAPYLVNNIADGRLNVTPFLQAKGQQNIYAIGDIAGTPNAQNAVQQGKYLAHRFNNDMQNTEMGNPYKYSEWIKLVHCRDGIVIDTKYCAFIVPNWCDRVIRFFYSS